MELITSRDNRAVKDYVRLCESRRHRVETGRFPLEGARLLGDALQSGVKIESAFFEAGALARSPQLAQEAARAGARVFEISQPVGEKLSSTGGTQGVFAVALMLDKALSMDKIYIDGAYAALENIQDPGNLGALLRTAEAFGLNGVLLSKDCADIYSPKAVRAGMGAVFRLPFCVTDDLCGALHTLTQRGLLTLAAVADRGARDILSLDLSGGVVAVIGNEGNGLTDEAQAACHERVTVRMRGRAESLNAAAAGTVVLWEIVKNRPPIT